MASQNQLLREIATLIAAQVGGARTPQLGDTDNMLLRSIAGGLAEIALGGGGGDGGDGGDADTLNSQAGDFYLARANHTGTQLVSTLSNLGTGVATFLIAPSGESLATALTTALPASKGGTGLTALGTGVPAALGIAIGSAGAPLLFDGVGSFSTLSVAGGIAQIDAYGRLALNAGAITDFDLAHIDAAQLLSSRVAGGYAQVIRGQTAQSAALTVWQDVSGATLATMGASGILTAAGGSFSTLSGAAFGTGVATALAIAVNTAGGVLTHGGAGAHTTLSASGAVTFTAGTASTTTGTGTVVVTGGVGASGQVTAGSFSTAGDYVVGAGARKFGSASAHMEVTNDVRTKLVAGGVLFLDIIGSSSYCDALQEWRFGGVTKFASDLNVTAAGKGLQLKSGTGARAGEATLVAGTITVTNTTAGANTKIHLTRKTSGGTIGTAITYTISNGASFTINSDNPLDTSTFSYLLIEVN